MCALKLEKAAATATLPLSLMAGDDDSKRKVLVTDEYRANFRHVIRSYPLDFADDRGENSLYHESVICLVPSEKSSSGICVMGNSSWNYRYSSDGSKMTISVVDDKNGFAVCSDAIISAVNHNDGSLLFFEDSGTLTFEHEDVLVREGFVDRLGKVKLLIQIQAYPGARVASLYGDPSTFHRYHRGFLLELYWVNKRLVDDCFTKIFDDTKTTLQEFKKEKKWKEYLNSNPDLSMATNSIWEALMTYCEHCIIAAIVYAGLKFISEPPSPKKLPIFVKKSDKESEHKKFCLIDNIKDLSRDSKLQGLNLNKFKLRELHNNQLNCDGVKSFESQLLMAGCGAFQSYFLCTALKQSYYAYTFLNTTEEPDITSNEGAGIGSTSQSSKVECDFTNNGGDDKTTSEAEEAEQKKCFEKRAEESYKIRMDPVVISGSNFRADMIALRDDLDKNGKCFPGLRAMISAKHQEAQAQAYHQFREDELDLFDKDEIILREKSYIEKKSNAVKILERSEKENRDMARDAEKHAHKYYVEKFKDTHDVKWANHDGRDQGHGYDIMAEPKEGHTGIKYIEVKSTSVKNRRHFKFSRAQYELAGKAAGDYIIAHIKVDLTQKDDNKKYTFTEYINPVFDPNELDLFMYSKEKRVTVPMVVPVPE